MGAITSYLRHNWPHLLIETVGVVLAVYFYRQSREEREPVFVVDPNRVEILSAERVATAPIKVLRRDNAPIQADLYAVRFYFWNAGKRSIRPENVLDTIRITLQEPGSEILDFKPLKTSRPIAQIHLEHAGSGVQKLHTLLLTFSILERGDGLAGQIIYQGSAHAALRVSGAVEGGEIQTATTGSFWAVIRRSNLGTIAVSVLAAAGILIFLSLVMPRVMTRLEPHKRLYAALPIVILVTPFIVALIFAYQSGREKVTADVVNIVPPRLIP